MDSAQNDFVEFFDMLEPRLEVEQPTILMPSPGYTGLQENQTTRIFLNALEQCPDIWKNILSQKQNRKDNPGWEYIRAKCSLRDVDDTRKYYETIKKDIVRRVGIAIKKNVITYDKLPVDGLTKLHESQHSYKYWDEAEFLVKHVILKRLNYDLDSMPARTNLDIGGIKRETPEDQHQGPDAFTAQSTATEVGEENSCQIDITENYPYDIQLIKQEQEPIDDSQLEAGPSSPENLEGSSTNAEDVTTLIDNNQDERSVFYDGDSTQTQVRMIMSGVEIPATSSNGSGNLPTFMEVQDVDMEDEDMDQIRKEMAGLFTRLWERICVLPSEQIDEVYIQYIIFGHKLKTLFSQRHGWDEVRHELRTFQF